jgi:serine/threonine protein kinase
MRGGHIALQREGGPHTPPQTSVHPSGIIAHPLPALAIGTRLGPYEVLAFIGAGGMGEVYRARDTTLNRDVALKILPDGVFPVRRRS